MDKHIKGITKGFVVATLKGNTKYKYYKCFYEYNYIATKYGGRIQFLNKF